MPSYNLVEAIRDALYLALEQDESYVILGEDVGKYGGVFRATDGLQQTFGEERVVDTPLAESGIVGTAIGLALGGVKPICEIQFLAFLYPAFEQLISHVSRMRARTQGNYSLPMVIRAPVGGGVKSPELHSESSESYFVHTPGLKVVMPSNPMDAKGLLLASLADKDPVLFLEPTILYRSKREDIPSEIYQIPLGQASLKTTGSDVTMISWGGILPTVHRAVIEMKKKDNISCELIDLRTLSPLDEETIIRSVQKTGRAIVIHEAHRTLGLGAEIASLIQEHAFLSLEAPVLRVTGYDVPVPQAALEDFYRPNMERIKAAVYQVLNY